MLAAIEQHDAHKRDANYKLGRDLVNNFGTPFGVFADYIPGVDRFTDLMGDKVGRLFARNPMIPQLLMPVAYGSYHGGTRGAVMSGVGLAATVASRFFSAGTVGVNAGYSFQDGYSGGVTVGFGEGDVNSDVGLNYSEVEAGPDVGGSSPPVHKKNNFHRTGHISQWDMHIVRSILTSGCLTLLSAVALLTSCIYLTQSYNASGLEEDMERLLVHTAGLSPRDFDCKMIGASRAGLCLFPLNSTEFDDLANRFALIAPPAIENRYFETWVNAGHPEPGTTRATTERGCRYQSGFENARVVFTPEPRKGPIREHIHFEYFLLFRNATTGQACAQTSYSYG